MPLKEKIRQNLNEALKSKEELKTSVLRLLSSSILNKEKEKRYKSGEAQDVSLADEEVLDVISFEAKKRRESIIEFQKGGRDDLVNKEKAELEILQKYLPEQLKEEELKKISKEAVAKAGAKELKDMGKVMAVLMPQVKGRADGNLVSKIIKDLLTASK